MAHLDPQVLVQATRRMVSQHWHGKLTELHAPPIPEGPNGPVSDDPAESLATLDVRLLQQCGVLAYYSDVAQRSAWPVPLGLSPHELALFGAEHGVLQEHPARGDILLQCSFRTRQFVHAGLVMTVDGTRWLDHRTMCYDTSTIEGDTDHRGLLGRGYTCKLRRRLSPTQGDRFLRWCELEVDVELVNVATPLTRRVA